MLMALASVAGLVSMQSVFAQDATAPTNAPPAEGKHHGHGGWGNPVERLNKALNLTAEEQTQVKAIFDELMPQMKAIREDQSLSQDDKKAKSKELRTAADAKIRALLTPEQQTAFDEYLKNQQQHGHHKAPTADQ
jgi:Spy/CpxP family protein refolding chaperone